MIEIRQAAEGDAAAVRDITVTAYQHYVERIGHPPRPMTADHAAWARSGGTWLATDAGRPVGVIVLVTEPDHLLVENIAVLPGTQRGGIGTRLLALADEQARALGLAEIRLYTHVLMTENIAWYPRHGYTETHRSSEGPLSRVFFSRQVPPDRTVS